MIGQFVLPGIGGLLGSAIGGLFGGKEEQERQTAALQRIDENTRSTARILDLNRQMVDAQRRFFNVPPSFGTLPTYTPSAGARQVDVTINQVINVTSTSNITPEVVEAMRAELGPLLQREIRRIS